MAEGTNIIDQSTSSKQTSNKDGMDFVTVVSVGSEEDSGQKSDEEKCDAENDQQNSGYVTVLKIGQPNNPPKEVIEEVLVYRLPGERLGFGLKFEGGTKAAEFVKRLFIQSCAPDSPASMVHCSWGKLTEGDEVLNIDSLPVTSMTRIDCVRCLKDSNVVIKLLVRHFYNKTSEDVSENNDSSVKATEDLPLVIGAEKKRTPPPPPPVPPRKIPRKMLKENNNNNVVVNTVNPTTETDSSPLHNNNNNEIIVNGHRSSRFHSPRSSGRFAHSRQSPEVSRHVLRDRRLSDDSVGPPDAEVYLDLFSQESGCNLSESDDTGSSISTIIDRFSSIPTTTNSSLAGSLPSTPTSIQKHLDVSNITNPFDLEAISSDNYLFSKLVSSRNGIDEDEAALCSKNNEEIIPLRISKDNDNGNDQGDPLQPPMNFQDAPLSYGNEDVEAVKASVKVAATESVSRLNYQNKTMNEMADENGNCLKQSNVNKMINKTQEVTNFKIKRGENKKRPPPPPPPCEKPKIPQPENNDAGNDVCEGGEMNAMGLPRLVYFVPKSSNSDNRHQSDNLSETIETTKLFLENEIRDSEKMLLQQKDEDVEENLECSLESSNVPEIYTSSELYNLTWSISPQLATIGEDDEDSCHDNYFQKSSNNSTTPIVIIENADSERRESENSIISSERSDAPDGSGSVAVDDIEKSEDENVSIIEPEITSSSSFDSCETMDAPPSASRQPPDGHEFPDYHETPITPKPIKMEDSSNRHSSPWLNNSLWKTNTSSLLFRDQQSSCSVRDKIAIFSNASKSSNDLINTKKISESADDILGAIEKEPFTKVVLRDTKVKRSVSVLCKTEINSVPNEERPIRKLHHNSSMSASKARSSLDLTSTLIGTSFLSEERMEKSFQGNSVLPRLHTRSQSLMDISSTDTESTPKKDRWNLLAEQRQRSLSKLKGLIIPERVVEVDLPNVVDLPEIKSNDPPTPVINSTTLPVTTTLESPIVPCQRNIGVPSLSVPPWSNPNSNNIPKYSPAFKRKSLQLHSNDISSKIDITDENASSSIVNESAIPTRLNQKQLAIKSITQPNIYDNQDVKITGSLCLADAPKSLESITSPTQSDCSFEYNSPPDTRTYKQEQVQKDNQLDVKIGFGIINKTKEDLGKSEDESDNDSAVSSSQSSYISRTSPPTSPSHLHSNFTSRSCNGNESDSLAQLKCHSTGSQSCDNQNHRLLKPQSVEAINRKNILASAKCRSGRDLKIGSPLIQRKFEEEFVSDNTAALPVNNSDFEYNSSKYCATIHEKINDVPNISESSKAQGEIASKEEDDLFVNNKPDLTNDCGMQPRARNESKHITGQTRSNVNENCLKASVSTTVVTNAEIIHKDIKIGNKSIGREVSNLTNGQERKTAITRPLTRELRSTSVTNLRKSFEKLAPLSPTTDLSNVNLNKRNSFSATKNNQPPKYTSQPSSQPPVKSNLTQETIASSKDSTNKDIEIIVLRPEIPGGSVGITLAGGADYENKEITVHKIREDSSAHRDGRLQKGDKVVLINGKSVDGLTHKELVTLLKEPLPEITLAVSKQQKKTLDVVAIRKSSISAENLVPTKQKENTTNSTNQRKIFIVSLVKDAAGLGLSLEGGKDSPLGNMPLLIKKIFKGGSAEKSGNLHMGDELLLVNETDVTTMSRFEAWSVLKKLPEGITISLTVKR